MKHGEYGDGSHASFSLLMEAVEPSPCFPKFYKKTGKDFFFLLEVYLININISIRLCGGEAGWF